MKAVAFYNNKGGVGKTTLSTQISVFCGSYQKFLSSDMKVLFIDLDEQMNGTQFMTPIAPDGKYIKNSVNRDIRNLFKYNISDVISDVNFPVEKAITKTVFDNVDMIPGDLNIKVVANEVVNAGSGSLGQLNLNKQIRKLSDIYQYVFIDCPPSKASGETALGMFLADAVIIPILADPYSLYSLSSCYEMIENISKSSYSYTQHGLMNLGIVFNQFQASGSMDKHFLNDLLSNTNFPFSGICIRKAAKVSQDSYFHEPIVNIKRLKAGEEQSTPVSQDFFNLAYYILSSLKKGEPDV